MSFVSSHAAVCGVVVVVVVVVYKGGGGMSFAPSRHQPRQRRELPPPLGAPERAGVSKANAAKASRPMRPKDADKAKPVGARRRLVAGGNAAAQKQKKGLPDAEDEKAKYLAELSTEINCMCRTRILPQYAHTKQRFARAFQE